MLSTLQLAHVVPWYLELGCRFVPLISITIKPITTTILTTLPHLYNLVGLLKIHPPPPPTFFESANDVTIDGLHYLTQCWGLAPLEGECFTHSCLKKGKAYCAAAMHVLQHI